MSKLMKIKIISEGDHPVYTRVINADTGELLPVVAVKWEMDIRKPDEPCRAWVLLDGVQMEADGLRLTAGPVEFTAVGNTPSQSLVEQGNL